MGFWKSLVPTPQPSSEPTPAEIATQKFIAEDSHTAQLLSDNDASLPVTVLPDDTPYVTVVNGIWVNTVGEYKAALPSEHDGY